MKFYWFAYLFISRTFDLSLNSAMNQLHEPMQAPQQLTGD